MALADPDRNALQRASDLDRSVAMSADPMALCRGDLAEIDAVLIASPTRFHAEQAEAALRAGLHTYLEKPLATSLDEAEGLCGVPLDSGQVVHLGFNYRFDPAYSDVARWLADRDRSPRPVVTRSVGPGATQTGTGTARVRKISMSFRAPTDPAGTWRRPEEPGGGVLLDLFSHDVDLLALLGFRFLEIAAEERDAVVVVTGTLGPRSIAEVDLPRSSDATSFEGFYSYRSADEARCRVLVEDGAISYDRYRDLSPSWRSSAGAGVVDGVRNAVRQVRALGTLFDRRSSPWRQPSFRVALRAFAAAIRGVPPVGGVPGASLEDGLRCLRAVDAAQRSLLGGGLGVGLSRTVGLPT